MPLPSLLRVITSLSCTVTLFTELILNPGSMMVHANRAPPKHSKPPDKTESVDAVKHDPIDGVFYNADGTIKIDLEVAHPGTLAFLKYLNMTGKYDKDKGPWSKWYDPMHAHVVRTACDIAFDTLKGSSPNKIIYGNACKPKYESLLVFIPDDVDMANTEFKLELVQGVILSVMLSGVFKKDAEITLITSIPKLDAKGTPQDTLPHRTLNIRDACYSLASDHNNGNMIRLIMSEAIRQSNKATFGDKSWKNKITPLNLVQAWYTMAILTSGNSRLEEDPNVFALVHDYYKKFEDKTPSLTKMRYIDFETKSLYGITHDTVLLMFGNNDVYARLLYEGVIGVPSQLGIENYGRKKLDPQVGINDMSYFHRKNVRLGVKDPIFCTPVYVCDQGNHSASEGNIAPIFKDAIRQSGNSADSFEVSTPAIVKNCYKYTYHHDPEGSKGWCTLSMALLGDYVSHECNGTTVANEHLANILSIAPPKKIIQIQLAPDVNNKIYKKISNVESLSILQTIMGCPDFLPKFDINKYDSSLAFNKKNDNPDKGMLSVCTPPEHHIDNEATLRLRSNSFAQAYNRAHMMNNDVSYTGYTGEGCANSVLTLYASADERSIFHYPKISNYFNTIISRHLNDPCIDNDSGKMTFGDVSLWNNKCTYYPDNNTFEFNNIGDNTRFTPEYVKMLLSIQNGLYAWYNPVDCRNFNKSYNKNENLSPRMKCVLSNKSLLMKINGIYPSILVPSNDDT